MEIWKQVFDKNGIAFGGERAVAYFVSSKGRVASLTKKGAFRILKNDFDKGGYPRVALWKNGRTKHYFIHRLVLRAFVGVCPKGLQVDHINRNRTDNRLENLRYVTVKENNDNRSPFVYKGFVKPPKPVRCVDTGECFCSIHEASRKMNLFPVDISRSCRTARRAAGFKFVYLGV